MTTIFWLCAIVLAVMATGFVLAPLRGGRRSEELSRRDLNIALYEERLAELEADESITDPEREALRLELQKSLLGDSAETSDETASPVSEPGGIPRLALVAAVAVPVLAFVLYADFGLSWGSINDVETAELLIADDNEQLDLASVTTRLAESLENQPENYEGWFMLGRAYLRLGNYNAAVRTFDSLRQQFPQDPGIASFYAESVFLAADRKMTPEAAAAIDATLALNPHDLTMLEIKGMTAFQQRDFEKAREQFELALNFAQGQRAELIQSVLARIPGGEQGAGTRAESSEPRQQAETRPASTSNRAIKVLVEVSETLDDPGDSVFIYARAVNGPPMPLAVQRLTLNDLPTVVTLDESMAMMGGMGLANFDEVEVVARISSSGIANASPEDYEARSAPIDLTQSQPVIKMMIKSRRHEVGG